MSGEFIALACAIEGGSAPLPPFTGRLIQQAPDSFVDPRAGEIACTVRKMRRDGVPVSVPAVCGAHVKHITFIAQEISNSALPPGECEFYAEKCWREYQARRAQSVFADAHAAVSATPDRAESIIENAVDSLSRLGAERGNGLTIRTPAEILDMVFDDADIILGDRVIAEGQSCVIAAAGGSGKSRIVLQMAACVSTGRKFLNFSVGHPNYAWLILQTENSNRRLHDDLHRLKSWLGDDWPDFAVRVKFHTVENDADSFVNLDSPDAVANIQGAIEQHRPDIIVIDPLNDFAIGDLNKDADMKMTLQTLSRVCRKGNPRRAIIVLHHALTGRAGAARATGFDRASFGRNSKTLHAWTRAQINLAPADADSYDRLIVACGKCSNGREFPTFAVRLNPKTMIYECDPTIDVNQWEQEITGVRNEPTMNPDRVRELCETAGSTKKALAKAIIDDCGCYRGSAYRYISRAEQAKKINFNKSNETYFRK